MTIIDREQEEFDAFDDPDGHSDTIHIFQVPPALELDYVDSDRRKLIEWAALVA